MATLYHGTTLENFRNMLATEFGSHTNKVWHCSVTSCLYFYDAERIADVNYMDDESEIESECIRRCFEQAKIAASVQNYTGNELVVLKLSVDNRFVMDDDSCPEMSEACCVYTNNLSRENIEKVFIDETGYYPSLRLMYVCHKLSSEREQLLNKDNFSGIEKRVAACISTSQPDLDDIYECDWRELHNAF